MQPQNESPAWKPERDDNRDTQPLADLFSDVLQSSRRQVTELLDLMLLEARYSGLMLGVVLAMAVLSVLAGFSVWGLLLAVAVSGLLESGWSMINALAMLALANGVLLFLALWLMRCAIVRVGFPATRRVTGLGIDDVPR